MNAESGLELDVQPVGKGGIEVVVDGSIAAAYDISLKKDGRTVQPDGYVTVKIPCDDPEAKIYRVEDDGSLTDMKATYKDGYLVFTTDHFSLYIVASAAQEPAVTYMLGDVDESGKVNVFDASYILKGTTGTNGYPDYKNMDSASLDFKRADVDGTGSINIFDAAIVLKYATGDKTVTKYGIGEMFASE